MTADRAAIAAIVIGLIADTFDVAAAGITDATTAEDVPGWDSLGHSVLLTRLARRLGIGLTEADAGFVQTVGELIDRLATLRAAAPT